MSSTITIELTRLEDRDPVTNLVKRPGNGQVFIEPLEQSRRARWQKNQHMPPEARTDPRIAHAPEILRGYQIKLDIANRQVEVRDPLYKCEAFDAVVAAFRDRLGRRLDIEKPIVFTGLKPQQLWAWVKWMYRADKAGDADKVQGEWPEVVEARVAIERQWDLSANPQDGTKVWQAEPELTA